MSTNKTGELTFKPDSSDNIRALTLYGEVVGVNPTLATIIINNLKTNQTI